MALEVLETDNMYESLAVLRTLLAVSLRVHAREMPLPEAAERIRTLAAEAATAGDPIEGKLIEVADAFDAGDLCTVIVPSLLAHIAVDDGAVPHWRQSDGKLIVYLEADARAQVKKDADELRARFPGFPKPRP